MSRQVGAEPHLAQARVVQKQLAAQGIDEKAIEQLFAQPGKLDAILSDNRLLLQYFQIQSKGLTALTSYDFDNPFMAGSGQVLPPNHNHYISYYSAERDPQGSVPGQDYIPEDWVTNSNNWSTSMGFTPDQTHWFNVWMTQGLYGDVGDFTGTTGSSGGPKAMAVGRPKAMAAGGGVKFLGSKTPIEIPPTPPGGGGGSGGGYGPTPFAAGGTLFNQTAYNYINSLEGGWGRDVLNGLFQDENYSNGVCYNIMTNIQGQKNTIQDIQNFINGIDTSTPEGRHQFTVASQQLGDLQGNVQQLMDALGTVKRQADERKEYVKSMMDTVWRAQDSIIRNVRPG